VVEVVERAETQQLEVALVVIDLQTEQHQVVIQQHLDL
tara:strand:- start:450 stop:563 length:114 start_codon:yes stop_codon:yes gene_type:complete